MKKKKVFYVQIDRVTYPTYWYAECIGQVFSVVNTGEEYPDDYRLASRLAYISKKDCHKIKVNEYPDTLYGLE